MSNLSETEQRLIKCILHTNETNPVSGNPQADTTQIRNKWEDANYGDIPKPTLKRKLGNLVDNELLSKDQRDRDEMETNRIPPSLYVITDSAMDIVGQVEDQDGKEDPADRDELQTQISEAEAEIERLKQVIQAAYEKQEETSKHYYTKVSEQVDKNRESIHENEEQATNNGYAIDSLQSDISRLESQIEQVEQSIEQLQEKREMDKDAIVDAVRKIAERLDSIEDKQDRRGGQLDHIEDFLQGQFAGGWRTAKYESYNT